MRNILVLLGIALGMARAALGTVDMLVLYNGEVTLPANTVFGFWGAVPREGTDLSFTPVPVAPKVYGIPFALQGRYQGVRVDFPTPINTDTFLGKGDAFLELFVRSTNFTPSARVPFPPLTSIRVNFFTQGGSNTLAVPASEFFPLDEVDGNWIRLAVPMKRLNAKYPINGDLLRLLITTDSPVKFLLGRIAFTRDIAMLHATISTFPATLRTGEPVNFSASVEGGLTPYTLSWNFGLTADRTTVDATGEVVTATFPQAGSYTVTCTVRDTDGIKDPISVTRIVKVTGVKVPNIKVNIDN